jgi:hypothetical protein
MRILFAAILTLCISSYVSAQEYQLQLKLQQGQRFAMSSDIDMDMQMNLLGQDMKVKNKMTFNYTELVKALTPDGGYKLELTFDRIGMNMSGIMGQSFSYDTDKKDGDRSDATATIGKAFNSLIGRKFTATVSPLGKVTSIEGLKEMIDTLSSGMDSASATMLRTIADEEKLKSSLQSSYGYLPDHKIKIGGTWTQSMKIDFTIPVNTDLIYTLKSVKGNIAQLGITATSHTKDDNYQMGGVTMQIDLNTLMDGTGELDIVTGVFSKTKMNTNMKGSMSVMGMDVPLTATGISETAVKEMK